MGKGTSIEWTDVSWPVVNGCRRVSAGCENCYAERLSATRLKRTPKYEGLAAWGKNGPRWTGETRLWRPHLALPLTIRKPSRIFVADMGDLFYEGVSDEDIAAVFGVMAACSQHTFQVLTKRPERMKQWFASAAAKQVVEDIPLAGPWPWRNVWLGVSVEDQDTADERIPLLWDTPACMRFISYEPALGPIDIRPWLRNGSLGWVIVGGESGPGARPFGVSWARSVIRQCRATKVAAFVKQLGARPMFCRGGGHDCPPACNCGQPHFCEDGCVGLRLQSRKGGDMAEWPEDLRVREFPETGTAP